MISRITMRKSGLADYLKDGHRQDSIYNRQEKDNVISLYGNLEHLKQAEIYTNKYKEWKNNYEHIVISFSKEDMKRLDTLNDSDRLEALNDIALQMIKHRTSGYDLENEVIAYAEVHQPKIKHEFGKDRLEQSLNFYKDSIQKERYANIYKAISKLDINTQISSCKCSNRNCKPFCIKFLFSNFTFS